MSKGLFTLIFFPENGFSVLIVICLVLSLPCSAWANERPSSIELPAWNFETGFSSKSSEEISENLFGLPSSFFDSIETSIKPRTWLGVSISPATSPINSALSALKILKVFPQSPGEKAGLKTGDLITGLNEARLEKGEVGSLSHHFRKQIAGKDVGETIRLRVERDKEIISLEVELGSKPYVPASIKTEVEQATPIEKNKTSLLDHLLKSSGQMPEFKKNLGAFGQRADEVVSTAVKGATFNPFRLKTITSLMHRPLALPAVGDALIDNLNAAWKDDSLDLSHLLEHASRSLDYEPLTAEKNKADSPQTLTQYLDRLIKKLTDIQKRYRKVIENLGPDEITRLENWFKKWMASVEHEKRSLTPEQKKKSEVLTLDLLNTAMKIDVQEILKLANELAQAIDIPLLQKLADNHPIVINYPQGWVADPAGDRTLFHTPAGLVVIGKGGPNVYTDDAVLIFDIGGDDLYRNRAGGARPGLPFTIVIDLAGDDRYLSEESFAQGSGFLGAGFLVDLKGNDFYHAGTLSQGAGVFGTGMLVDLEGRDHYRCQAFCQAAGGWGIGMLVDGIGYDDYSTDLYAQGFGFVKGFGVLLDRAGNDHYFAGGRVADFRQEDKATQSMAQGFGLGLRPWETVAGTSGGIGILSDSAGNDIYAADYFAQGSSYWLALGILHDGAGHDQYIAGRYAQGAGVHYSLGLLTDLEGDDQYHAHFGVSQGCGHDFAAGFLMDGKGDDRYISRVLAQGVGNANGLGVLADTGGRDEYYVRSEGQGRGHFEPLREMGSFGFLLDIGGEEDRYSIEAQDNRAVVKDNFGFTADIN